MTTGELTTALLETSVWSDALVAQSGLPVRDVPVVSVGGGLGSLALAHVLQVAGVSAGDLSIVGNGADPARTYRYLASNSQIPDHERLRSDAGSTMDNIWGFPSYAWREAFAAKNLSEKVAPLWQVMTEPLLTDYYTPRAGQVYRSIERECGRLSWNSMLQPGVVRMVRRRHEGGYFVTLTPIQGASDPDTPTQRLVFRCEHVHLAVGYPGVRFLKDLQEYREKHSDHSRVVNAYEPHDQVYEELKRRPSTVLVRGSGIVASRILQRLLDDREKNGAQTTVIHLFRNYVDRPQGESATFRRPGGNGVAYQGFNFPKASWGGQLKEQFERLDGQGRADLIGKLGGTNTPQRADWMAQLKRGQHNGYYQQQIGTVQSVEPGPNQTITTTIKGTNGAEAVLSANVVIDATGLEADITQNRLLADLLDHGGASRNAYGRLEVTPRFEISGTQSGHGRMYASGSITLGGYYAGVDSFLGLQYAALAIADDLATVGAIPAIGSGRSLAEWWRWVRNRAPVARTTRLGSGPQPVAPSRPIPPPPLQPAPGHTVTTPPPPGGRP